MGIIVIQNDCEEVNNDYSIIFVLRNMSFLRKNHFFRGKQIHFDDLENKLLDSTGRYIFSQNK